MEKGEQTKKAKEKLDEITREEAEEERKLLIEMSDYFEACELAKCYEEGYKEGIKVAKYAVDKMLKGKEIIIPGVLNKIVPIRVSKYVMYVSQNGKRYY